MQKVAAKPKSTTPKPVVQNQAGKAQKKQPVAAQKKKKSPVRAVGNAVGKAFQQQYGPVAAGAKRATQALIGKLTPLSKRETSAAKVMEHMLSKNKLGGANEKFGWEDVQPALDSFKGLGGIATKTLAKTGLPEALEKNGVVKKDGMKPDATPRKLSSREMIAFKQAGDILAERGKVLDKLGFKLAFPDGIPKAAFTHMLEGLGGLPPGATIVPKEPPAK